MIPYLKTVEFEMPQYELRNVTGVALKINILIKKYLRKIMTEIKKL